MFRVRNIDVASRHMWKQTLNWSYRYGGEINTQRDELILRYICFLAWRFCFVQYTLLGIPEVSIEEQ